MDKNVNADGTREVDLLILGAGAGGMACALAASLEGLSVLLCEKSAQVGGTAATSAGTVWIPGNSQSLRAGLSDSPDAARRYLDTLIASRHGAVQREAFLQTGPAAIDYFEEKSELKFLPCGTHPDYLEQEGAAVSGRALAPQPFDGRLLGKDFGRVRPPIPEFMVLGGMMVGKPDIAPLVGRFKSWSNFRHAAGLFLRYMKDRLSYPRGTRLVMGNALVARLYYSLRRAGVPVMFGAVARQLSVESGRVSGAVIETQAGERVLVRARRGVVLATGGYAHNSLLRQSCMPAPTPPDSLACADNLGEGILLGQQAGGHMEPREHRTGAFWTPVSKTSGFAGGAGLYPHLALDRAKPGLIAVNQAGKRFVNESASYHHFVEGMYQSDQSVPTIPAYLICETAFIRKYGLGIIYPGTRRLQRYEKDGSLVIGGTLEELARALKIDPQALSHTLAQYNADAVQGIDREFGKGSTELNRFNGDPAHQPNPCLAPIEQGPFCAMPVWPAEIACSTGLETDENGVVCRPDGTGIEGLYACGNDMASIMNGTYPGPGTTLGPALVFGYRIAIHARSARTHGSA